MGKMMQHEDIEKIANEVIDVLIENRVSIEFIDNIFDCARDKAYESPIKKLDSSRLI